MVKNGGLNPQSGIKLFPFESAGPGELKVWQQRRDALFAQITEDIKSLRRQRNSMYDYAIHRSL